MRSESSFARNGDLIVVDTLLRGPRGSANTGFVVDTGAAITTVMPHVAELLGYTAKDGMRRTIVRSPLGEEAGYLLRIASFSALHVSFSGFVINVLDLGYDDIDGLLGMNFLNALNFEVRTQEQRILIEQVLGREMSQLLRVVE